MIRKILPLALAISVVANIALWIAWRRARPVLTPTALEASLESTGDEALESARELAFLRELLARWSSFQSATYLQSQANVLPWLAPELSEERKKEIQRVAKRLRDQNVEQESHLIRIDEKTPHVFQTVSDLDLNENGKLTRMSIEQLVETESDVPSLENAWGFRAVALTSKVVAETGIARAVALHPGHPTILAFACPVRGVSELDPRILKFKLVTTKESELILQPQTSWDGAITLQVECEKMEFSFELKTAAPSLRYARVPMSAGRPVVKPHAGVAHPNRDFVKRSLETELGFQIEESDK